MWVVIFIGITTDDTISQTHTDISTNNNTGQNHMTQIVRIKWYKVRLKWYNWTTQTIQLIILCDISINDTINQTNW